MKGYNFKHLIIVALTAVLLLIVIGLFCYRNESPIDALTSATPKNSGIQKDGAISHIVNGEGR